MWRRENAKRLGLAVDFVVADLLDGIGHVDAVLANLPYVEQDAQLEPELSHEPSGALFAGADGLDVFRRFVPSLQVPWVALEVGAGQAADVGAMFANRERPRRSRTSPGLIGWWSHTA